MQFTDIAAVQITTEPMYSIKGTVFYNFNFSRLGKFFEILLDINQPGHKRCRHRLDMGGTHDNNPNKAFKLGVHRFRHTHALMNTLNLTR